MRTLLNGSSMSYQVLARKWRPKSFETLVGQEHIVRALTHALATGRLHHAWLFTGTRGVGKTTISRILAKALNCETGVTATPCGVCDACKAIDADRFPDYVEMDAASNRGVDDMAALLERAVYAPVSGRYKVYMIDEVHQLSGHAFNAMLKTLEEPPAHVKFILATTDPQKIPVTVLSRCLQFNLKQMPQGYIVEHLSRILHAEGISFEPGALRHLAHGAAGSMRDALSLLDQAIAHGAGQVLEEQVMNMLGTVGDDHLHHILDALAGSNAEALIMVADAMETRSLSFGAALQALASLLARVSLAKLVPAAITDEHERSLLVAQAEKFDAEYLQLAYQIAIHGRDDLPLAPDEYTGFTMSLLRLLAFQPERSAPSGVGSGSGGGRRPVSAPASAVASPSVSGVQVEASASIVVADDAEAINLSPSKGDAVTAALDQADWRAMVVALGLSGVTRELAQHCEWVALENDTLKLRLSSAYRHLAELTQATGATSRSQAISRIEKMLCDALGRPLNVVLDIGESVGQTPAERDELDRLKNRRLAVAALESDPVVAGLIERFGARLDVESASLR